MSISFDLFGDVLEKDELLKDKFGIIPFSVLDSKTKEWRKRKKIWLSKGIKSELGRDDDLMSFQRIYSKGNKRLFEDRKTSVFCPVLTELMYKWFCIDGGKILDPFAGGSVRGIVANYLNYNYCGIELREEQVKSNVEQSNEILINNSKPNWMVGDSEKLLEEIDNESFDMVFTCPPYFDLEVYSDNKDDLSNMDFDNFVIKYKNILNKVVEKLKNNRFLCIVIGDVRDKDRTKNWYRDLISLTKNIIQDNEGMHLYNDIILLDNIGTSAMRVEQAFTKRKLVKIHQNVLVFYKGENVNDIRDEFNK
jgi:DNA modification methylase